MPAMVSWIMRPRSGSVSSSISNFQPIWRNPRAAIVSPIPCPIPTWSRPRPQPSRTPITNCWSARPAPLPMPSWPRFRRSAPSRSPFTSRTRRSLRSSRMSAWSSPAPGNRRRMANALIALGGNVGDVRATFQKAIANICGMTQAALLARSSDYATPPWGEEQQAGFINACIEIDTSLDPHALLFTLHKIESKFGRDRASERRWGPRTLDLDLIAYDDVSIQKPELTLPHPRLFERAFVLVPLLEIAPDRVIAGRSVASALARLSTQGIERLPDLG